VFKHGQVRCDAFTTVCTLLLVQVAAGGGIAASPPPPPAGPAIVDDARPSDTCLVN